MAWLDDCHLDDNESPCSQAAASEVRRDDSSPRERASALTALLGVVTTMFPDNVVRAAVDMNILGVITFSLFFGICLSRLGPEGDGLVAGVQVSRLLLPE